VNIKRHTHADLLTHTNEIIYYEYFPPKQSTKHSTFKFWKIYVSCFCSKRQILWPDKWILQRTKCTFRHITFDKTITLVHCSHIHQTRLDLALFYFLHVSKANISLEMTHLNY
jgi:hypothetical protein